MADALPLTLIVEALPTGRYRLSASGAPSGPVTAEMAAPFTFGDLAHLGDSLEGRAGLSDAEKNAAARAFGEQLFTAVFGGSSPIADAYAKCRAATVNPANPLPIQVQLDKAGLLANVPWELLHDPKGAALQLTILPPQPKFKPIGGLREVLLRPRSIVAAAVAIIVIGLAVIGLRAITTPPGDVDLVVTSLRFLPAQPPPGQIAKVAITFRNNGTTDAGSFHWEWYEDGDTTQPPDLSGVVPALPAGTSLTVRSEFIFGWWGPYNTLVWANPFNEAGESQAAQLNNFAKGKVVTSNNPFVINWTFKPDTSLITDSIDLTGNEFSDWGLAVKTDPSPPGTSPSCANAVPHITVQMDANQEPINQLTTGLPKATSAGCDSVPLVFSISHGIGSVSIDFISIRGGSYTLNVADGSGKMLGTATAASVQPGAETTLAVPSDNVPLPATDSVQIRLSGTGGTLITTMTLGHPTS